MPVCKSTTYDFSKSDNVESNTKYLGDASKADWSSSGEPAPYEDSLLLTMSQGTVGTLLASTHYVWYGKVGARMKTSAGAGVVTAFILLSDTKDEIDFEFVGTDLLTAQSNFYSLGITNYDNGKNLTISSDSMANYHDYEIDWTPDQLTWSIDGKVLRTLKKSDTYNETSSRYSYPQSPARVQLSLWPAGLPSNPKGTIEWAGGEIAWDSPYMTNGYYYSQFDSVTIDCYDAPSDAQVKGSKSYKLTNKDASESDFAITDDPTVLGSFLATGLEMDEGKEEAAAASASSSGKASKTANTVPGMTGAGNGVDNHAGDTTASASQAQQSAATGSGSGSGSAASGFVQGGSSGASNMQPETVLSGSLFAVVIAIIGLCIL
ncbi:putative glycosidase CRH2 [Lithohypha guttulata]|uniref:Glycosidase CRH2 n=1 Tax=Lithohypha guttulata TaxID=1690604 RepID=A0ABR0JVX2_9EURO|nr:putative glycosidase CRH2 [Lithohypha guttulata]